MIKAEKVRDGWMEYRQGSRDDKTKMLSDGRWNREAEMVGQR
jgi:hypothetical protein